MPDNSNTVKITLQITDDGTIKIVDQTRGKIDDLGETTARASAKGESGLKAMKAGWLELAAGVTAGYFTIKKGIDTITGLVNIAAEAEQIEKRAAFQIETWGYKFQEIKPYVDAFAESIKTTTRFSDEMARQGLGRMMEYTSDINQAMQGVRLAMDISTKTGKGFDSMIEYIGIAMHGNVEILSKWIPELKDLEGKLGANATEAERWAYTQDRLNKMFGGAAPKDLQTYSGQLGQLKNEWNDLLKVMGKKIEPSAFQWVTSTKSIIKELDVPGTFWNRLSNTIESLSAIDISVPPVTIYKLIRDQLKDTSKELEEYKAANKAGEEASREAAKAAEEHAAKLSAEAEAAEAASMRRDPDRWKKWAEEFDGVTYALDQLGIKSTAVLSKEAADALRYAEVVKKAFQGKKEYLRDYINALNVAADAMKKLTGEDTTDKLVKNEEEYQKRIREISPEDPERQKKVQAAINDWQAVRKEIEKTAKIPVQADVAPMERQIQESIRKLEAQGITIPVTTSGGAASGGGGVETLGEWKNAVTGFSRGASGALMDLTEIENKLQGISDINIDIGIYGTGSSRKPITEKIQEIIDEFGGLENALSGMEAEINLAELTSEYNKLQTQLTKEQKFLTEISNLPSGTLNWNRTYEAIGPAYMAMFADLTEQMKILQMKMNYQMLKAYGGSYATGTRYVPQTGLYTLHEGEQVIPRNVSSNITIINHICGVNDAGEIGDKLTRILKYRLNTELNDLLRR
jgi:hypothetical protein